MDVLADDGVGGFTVDAVAKRSGVAKTTIYRHWPSGNALMLAAIDCQIIPFPTPNTGSLDSDLREFLGHVLPTVSDPKTTEMIMGVTAAASQDPELAELHQAMMAERTTPIRTIVELAMSRGEIPPGLDVDHVVDLIEGPFFMKKMVRREPIDEATIDAIVTFLVVGLEAMADRAADRSAAAVD